MRNRYYLQALTNRVRDLFSRPGLVQLKHLFRHLQAHARRAEFEQMRQLAAQPALAPLLARQPRFPYKYLSSYVAASFSRPMRLAAVLQHYQFLAEALPPTFLTRLAQQPVIWQADWADEQLAITLAYPRKAHFEGELSLHFYRGRVLLQMLTCVVVPGRLLGLAAPRVLLISQVQGTRDTEAIRLVTKHCHDTPPANLLVQACYGLAAALGLPYAAGVSSREQLGRGRDCYFDYDHFWAQFRGQRLPSHFYLLDWQAPERPLEEIKAKYRPRTLRKRALKQRVRQAVAEAFQTQFAAGAAVAA